MTDSTLDEHRRCPICGELGSPQGTKPGADRSTFYFYQCENPQCRWFKGAPWLRQRRRDGSWVEAQTHNKFFTEDKGADARTERIQQGIDAEIRQSMNRDGK